MADAAAATPSCSSTPSYTLVVGQKRYNSWGARPWILMRALSIPFQEQTLQIEGIGPNPRLQAVSPSSLIPLLTHGELKVWDSLAIAEYLYERHPAVWPAAPAARALARCIAAEMHSGFADVRAALSFNLGYRLAAPHALEGKVAAQVARIAALWRAAREAHGEGGPYLFGAAFTAADAMYAPVALRFHTYRVTLACAVAEAYAAALRAHPAVAEWAALALSAAEGEAPIAHYDAHLVALGGVKQERYEP